MEGKIKFGKMEALQMNKTGYLVISIAKLLERFNKECHLY